MRSLHVARVEAGALSVHDPQALGQCVRELRLDDHQFRRFRKALYKDGADLVDALAQLDPKKRAKLVARVDLGELQLDRRIDSEHDGASKLIFRTAEGFAIESVVLRVATGRVSLCVSSQIGCAAKCTFCATGKMGMARSLSTRDVLGQLLGANRMLRSEGRRVRNLVFMGMGEPMHNLASIKAAVALAYSPSAFNLSPRRILVSTVGVPAAMVDFATTHPQVGLALSLHSAVQQVRETIVPLASRHPLSELHAAVKTINGLGRGTVMLEYLMLAGINDSDDALRELVAFCVGLRVHINLIPYNAVEGANGLRPTTTHRMDEFAAALRCSGLTVTRRYSLGADIEAACGQLIRAENREILRGLK